MCVCSSHCHSSLFVCFSGASLPHSGACCWLVPWAQYTGRCPRFSWYDISCIYSLLVVSYLSWFVSFCTNWGEGDLHSSPWRISSAVKSDCLSAVWMTDIIVCFVNVNGHRFCGHRSILEPHVCTGNATVLEDDVIVKIADKVLFSPTQVCLRWATQRGDKACFFGLLFFPISTSCCIAPITCFACCLWWNVFCLLTVHLSLSFFLFSPFLFLPPPPLYMLAPLVGHVPVAGD